MVKGENEIFQRRNAAEGRILKKIAISTTLASLLAVAKLA